MALLLLVLFLAAKTNYATVTAYCEHGYMADSHYTHKGAIAADRRYYPFGTKIQIGKKIYTVEDTGSAIIGPGRFDIWMDSCDDAIQFGVESLPYQVL